MRRAILIACLFLFPSAASAKEFKQTWNDVNYVPCEDMGASASGTIELTIDYQKGHWVPFHEESEPAPPGFDYVQVQSIKVVTSYIHEHVPSASITYEGAPLVSEGGGQQKETLVEPWYDSVSSDDVKVLVGRRTLVRNQRADAQMGFYAKTSPMKLNVSVRFPREGGNCFSTFNKAFTLP